MIVQVNENDMNNMDNNGDNEELIQVTIPNSEDIFSLTEFLACQKCTYNIYGKNSFTQDRKFCLDCDPEEKEAICSSCFEHCHKNCNNSIAIQVSKNKLSSFICNCGLQKKHTVNSNKESDSYRMCQLKPIVKNLDLPEDSDSRCLFCRLFCPSNSSRGEIENNQSDDCTCRSTFHLLNEKLFHLYSLKANDYKSKILKDKLISEEKKNHLDMLYSNKYNGMQMINNFFSHQPVFLQLKKIFDDFFGDDLDCFRVRKGAFTSIANFLENCSRDWCYYFHNDFHYLLPYHNIAHCILNIEKKYTMETKLFLLKVFYYYHLKKDFKSFKKNSALNKLRMPLKERLMYLKSPDVYPNIDFLNEKYFSTTELNLRKISIRLLKRKLLSQTQLVGIILNIMYFALKKISFDLHEYHLIIDEFEAVSGIFSSEHLQILISIFSLITINYNDIISLSLLSNGSGEVSAQSQTFLHANNNHGMKLLKMIIKLYPLFEENKTTEFLIKYKLYPELLKMFISVDNLYYKDLLEISEIFTEKEFIVNATPGKILQRRSSMCMLLKDNLEKSITDMFLLNITNNEYINQIETHLRSIYVYLNIFNSQEKQENNFYSEINRMISNANKEITEKNRSKQIVENLIESSLCETLIKILNFSFMRNNTSCNPSEINCINLFQDETIFSILDVFYLLLLDENGIKYLSSSKILIKLFKIFYVSNISFYYKIIHFYYLYVKRANYFQISFYHPKENQKAFEYMNSALEKAQNFATFDENSLDKEKLEIKNLIFVIKTLCLFEKYLEEVDISLMAFEKLFFLRLKTILSKENFFSVIFDSLNCNSEESKESQDKLTLNQPSKNNKSLGDLYLKLFCTLLNFYSTFKYELNLHSSSSENYKYLKKGFEFGIIKKLLSQNIKETYRSSILRFLANFFFTGRINISNPKFKVEILTFQDLVFINHSLEDVENYVKDQNSLCITNLDELKENTIKENPDLEENSADLKEEIKEILHQHFENAIKYIMLKKTTNMASSNVNFDIDSIYSISNELTENTLIYFDNWINPDDVNPLFENMKNEVNSKYNDILKSLNKIKKKQTVENKMIQIIELFKAEILILSNMRLKFKNKKTEKEYLEYLLYSLYIIFFYLFKNDVFGNLLFNFYDLARTFIAAEGVLLKYSSSSLSSYLTKDDNSFIKEVSNIQFQLENKNILFAQISKIYGKFNFLNMNNSLVHFLQSYDRHESDIETGLSFYNNNKFKFIYEYYYNLQNDNTSNDAKKCHNLKMVYYDGFAKITKSNFYKLINISNNFITQEDYRQILISSLLNNIPDDQIFSINLEILNKLIEIDVAKTQDILMKVLDQNLIYLIFDNYAKQAALIINNSFILSNECHRFIFLNKTFSSFIVFILNLAEGFNFKLRELILTTLCGELIDQKNQAFENLQNKSLFELILNSLLNALDSLNILLNYNNELIDDRKIVVFSMIVDCLIEYNQGNDDHTQDPSEKLINECLFNPNNNIFKVLFYKLPKNLQATKRNMILFVKYKLICLFNSFIVEGNSLQLIPRIVEYINPSKLIAEMQFNLNSLMTKFNFSKKLMQESFENELLKLYISDEFFRGSIELNLAFKIYIFLRILSDVYNCTGKDFDLIKNGGKVEGENSLNEDSDIVMFKKIMNRERELAQSFKFLDKVIKKVEVFINNESFITFFETPHIAFSLSQNSITRFSQDIDRTTTFSKLNSLLTETDYLIYEMFYNSMQFDPGSIFRLVYFEIINFIFILAHQVLLFVHYEKPATGDSWTDSELFSMHLDNYILAIAQLVFNLAVIVIWFKFYFRLSFQYQVMHVYKNKFIITQKNDHSYYSHRLLIMKNLKSVDSLWAVNNSMGILEKIGFTIKETMLLNREINVFVYMIICLTIYLASDHSIFLVVPIIFVYNFSEILTAIILAITYKFNRWFTVLIYTFLIIYFFGWVAFYYMPVALYQSVLKGADLQQVNENMCHSAFECFLNSLNYGMRNGGGFGDAISMISYTYDRNLFIGQFFYNMIFYLIIILILGNVFLGIIVDAFAELRNKNDDSDFDKHNRCFICQITKDECINENINFDTHITKDHVMWNYVYFLTHIHLHNPKNLNYMENSTYEKIQANDISWIPIKKEAN